jgi:hypothetical protein
MDIGNGNTLDLGTRYLNTDRENYVLLGSPYAAKLPSLIGISSIGLLLTEDSIAITTESDISLLQG